MPDAADPEQFRRQAHARALERVVPLALQALTLAHPVEATQVGIAAIEAPPIGPHGLQRLRASHELAWKEARDIDERFLDDRGAMLVRALRFGLTNIATRWEHSDPRRSDPSLFLHEAEALWDELDGMARAGACERCPDVLSALADGLEAARNELGGSSLETAEYARERAEKLHARIHAFASTNDDINRAKAKVEQAALAFAHHLSRFGKQARDRAPTSWASAIAAGWSGRPLVRMPARLGPEQFRVRLADEEAEHTPPDAWVRKLEVAVERLRSIASMQGAITERSRSVPVDVARCRSIWSHVRTWVDTQAALTAVEPDCDRVREQLRSASDEQLLSHLVEHGVVEPSRRKRRTNELPALALVVGQSLPVSTRLTTRIAIFSGMGEKRALGMAMLDAQHAVCLAKTAVWLHAEVGPDAVVTQWLAKTCPDASPQAYFREALADPRSALHGLGLAFLADDPTRVVGLSQFYWAPLGLANALAAPSVHGKQPERVVETKLEPLTGDETDFQDAQ